MATYKISQLTTATAVSATNQFEINQNAASKSLEVSVLSSYVRSQDAVIPVNVSVSTADAAVSVVQSGTGQGINVKGGIRLAGSTSGYVGISPAAAAGSATYTLPSADGTNGQTLTTNGSGTLTWATASGGTGNVQTFTSSGTWTKPSGLSASSRVLIQAWGAGGAGAKTTNFGGGGGGGGYVERWVTLSSLGATETITIGAGGAASTGNGTAGGNTTVGSVVTAYGGGGGTSGTKSGLGGGGGGEFAAGANGGAFGAIGGGGVVSTSDEARMRAYMYQNGVGGTAVPTRTADAFTIWAGGGGSTYSNDNCIESTIVGGRSIQGGGGGGSVGSSQVRGTAGASLYGGSGGASGSTGTAGTAPGGGGGGSWSGNSGAGAAGQVIITVFPM